MWQKCPICNGTGISPLAGVYSSIPQCPTCLGARIISEISGLPPSHYQGRTDTISTGTTNSTTAAHQFVLDEYNSSSQTKCKICGLEKWQHPHISFT